eukprot:scaffold12108_cov97-Isochrysis_galbana.AAC.2
MAAATDADLSYFGIFGPSAVYAALASQPRCRSRRRSQARSPQLARERAPALVAALYHPRTPYRTRNPPILSVRTMPLCAP